MMMTCDGPSDEPKQRVTSQQELDLLLSCFRQVGCVSHLQQTNRNSLSRFDVAPELLSMKPNDANHILTKTP